ncbi:hypothetical protein ACFMBG_22390 [Leisingera sp. D0M16]|uniref:hypothetical protein n=1 Tax=Leisingera coralii TaxID=3351347 RepID=UPI003B7B06B3
MARQKTATALETARHLASGAVKKFVGMVCIPRSPKWFSQVDPNGANWQIYEPQQPSLTKKPKEPDNRSIDGYPTVVEPYILGGGPFLLASSKHQPVLELARWLEKLGGEVVLTNTVDRALQAIADSPGRWGLLAVFMDGFDEVDCIAERLLLMRSVKRDLPTILVSQDFTRHDFSTERMSLCDVSLSAPVSQTAFKQAVAQSISNNAIFRKSG